MEYRNRRLADLAPAEFEEQMNNVDKRCRAYGKIACWEDFRPYYRDKNFNIRDIVNLTNTTVDSILGCQGVPDESEYDYDPSISISDSWDK